jgi:hypothetical protein
VDYARGVVPESGVLTVGNLSPNLAGREDTGPSGSRVFRGLLDEMELFHRVLTGEEIQQVQRAPAPRAVGFEPLLSVRVEGAEVVMEWEAVGSFQVRICPDLNRVFWRNVAVTPEVQGFRRTVRVPLGSGTQSFLRLQSQ